MNCGLKRFSNVNVTQTFDAELDEMISRDEKLGFGRAAGHVTGREADGLDTPEAIPEAVVIKDNNVNRDVLS